MSSPALLVPAQIPVGFHYYYVYRPQPAPSLSRSIYAELIEDMSNYHANVTLSLPVSLLPIYFKRMWLRRRLRPRC